MTVKTRLIANVFITTALIVAISMASLYSLRFLKEKLTFFTEKSTPFQMRTIEFQRELQGCIASLVKVNAARNMSEFSTFHAEAEKNLGVIEDTQIILEKMGAVNPGVSDELVNISLDLFAASKERINSTTAATEAKADVLLRMQESAARLDDLDTYISNLQVNYSKAYTEALENTGTLSSRLRSIEELRNLVRELQLIVVTVQNAQKESTVLIAKGKLKSVSARIAKNEYFKSNRSIAAVTSGFTDKLTEYLKLQAVAVAQKNSDSIHRAAESGKDFSSNLNDLFQTLDQDTMLARDELTLAYGRQGNIFIQTSSANDILVANSQLIALGLMISSETNRLFTLDSIAELDKLEKEIRSLFIRILEREKLLETMLTNLNAMEELRILRTASISLATVGKEIYSPDGIMTKLKKKQRAIIQANASSDKLHAIVVNQSAKGKVSISAAQIEQLKAITAVNNMVRQSLSQIFGIAIAAIVIGIIFGFWMYRSVLLPLRMVLEAVGSQRVKVEEKADLATAVAGGDLSREVMVSEAIQLDPAQVKKDEMGKVLNALVGMSRAQVTLDRAFAAMTASLRSSREEGQQREHLKSGLFELNNILRVEQNVTELADRALAFVATFLGAGVGIIYQYDFRQGLLQTLSTYAITRSQRINDGFRLGEGLAGQVALEQKMICLNKVPSNYLPITSALGEADPKFIAIVPIMHNDTLIGVLELGSFKQFGDVDFEFLRLSLEGIAIAISVNRSRLLVNGTSQVSESMIVESI